MPLYDRVSMSINKMSQMSPNHTNVDTTEHTGIISDKNNCPDCQSRARDKNMNKEIVPNVTYAREEDKGILSNSISINTNSKNTSRTQVTIGTQALTVKNLKEQSIRIHESQSKKRASYSMRHWDQESQEIIDWFMAVPRMKNPFNLDAHRHVFMPDKFYESIMRDIQAGPSGPRNKYGAIMDDLKKLKAIMNGNDAD